MYQGLLVGARCVLFTLKATIISPSASPGLQQFRITLANVRVETEEEVMPVK